MMKEVSYKDSNKIKEKKLDWIRLNSLLFESLKLLLKTPHSLSLAEKFDYVILYISQIF